MASVIQKYRQMKTVDKLLIPGSLAIIIWIASFFSNTVNPWVAASVFLGFCGFIHLWVTRTMTTAALVVFCLQVIAFLPVSIIYAVTARSHVDDYSAVALGSLYLLAASYLAAWSTYRWNNGLWWPRLLAAFVSIDIIAPLIADALRILNFYFMSGIGLVLVALISVPWSRLKAKPADDIPSGIQDGQATEAILQLAKSVDGVTAVESKDHGVDFVLTKGKKTFNVYVLGKSRDIKISGNQVQYGPDNLQALLFHLGSVSRRNNAVPIVVNYSDSSMSFVELKASLTTEKRRGMPVILTTPPKMVQILKNA